MSDDFAVLLARVRTGDPDAAAELVRRYEPAIRVAVRANLTDPALRRHFDSMDVCQSVLGSFFVRAAVGQYDLDQPAQLVALLVRMTRNKVAAHARHYRQEKRDARRTTGGDEAVRTIAGTARDPQDAAAGKELLSALFTQLTGEERELAQRRAIGQDWAAIAADMGGTSESRRKQLARALDRLAPKLGYDEDTDE
jgi:RNA polymerase sigma-70 factor (ECF subfamily)